MRETSTCLIADENEPVEKEDRDLSLSRQDGFRKMWGDWL